MSKILDQFGRPAAYHYDVSRPNPNKVRQWTRYNYGGDFHKSASSRSRKDLLTAARYLHANSSIIQGAFREMADFSFPLQVQYLGKDKGWGDEAESWLRDWYRVCSVKGPPFDACVHQRVRMVCRHVDGDVATILTQSKNGYPLIQVIRGHRIGSRGGQTKVESGPYRGLSIYDGVIKNAEGRVVAYNILGASDKEDVQISARSMILSYDPVYSDQDRGISRLCASIEDLDDIKTIRSNELIAQEVFSTQTFVETNEDGRPTMGEVVAGDASDTTSPPSYYAENMKPGTMRYLKAGSGKIEVVQSDRPHANVREFSNDIITQAMYGIGWDPAFALAIKEPGGAWARTILQKVNKTIEQNHKVDLVVQRREVGYAISKAIQLGMIGAPPDGNWYSWGFVPTQPRITADTGNEENSHREDYKIGRTSLKDLSARRGQDWQELRDQRTLEIEDLLTRVNALMANHPQLSYQDALNLFEQRSPNALTNTAGNPAFNSPSGSGQAD